MIDSYLVFGYDKSVLSPTAAIRIFAGSCEVWRTSMGLGKIDNPFCSLASEQQLAWSLEHNHVLQWRLTICVIELLILES